MTTEESVEDWTPPRTDVEAERQILGILMTSPNAVVEAETALPREAFHLPIHRTIYDAIIKLSNDGDPTEPVAVARHLANDSPRKLASVGGGPYLHSLIAGVPIAAQLGHYVRIVAGLHQLRELHKTVTAGAQMIANAAHSEAPQIVEKLLEMLVDTDRTSSIDDGPKPWRDFTTPLLDEIEARGKRTPDEIAEGVVPTGWSDLDRLLGGGGKPGQLVIVAGRPGSGKSITAMGWAQHAAMKRDIPTAVFTLEMGGIELGCRLAAAGTRITANHFETGNLDDAEWASLARWVGETSDAPLFLDETPIVTVADIRARLRRLKRDHDIRLVVIDYLQLVSSPRAENRQVAVSAMTRGLKLLAKEAGCCLVLVAQLNRGPEQRADKRPEVSDLRESGSIEQDADVVILIHPMDGDDNPRVGEVDLIVGKQRGGAKGVVTLAAQLHLNRFVSLSVDSEAGG